MFLQFPRTFKSMKQHKAPGPIPPPSGGAPARVVITMTPATASPQRMITLKMSVPMRNPSLTLINVNGLEREWCELKCHKLKPVLY